MTRIVKAKDVPEGATVHFELNGFDVQGVIAERNHHPYRDEYVILSGKSDGTGLNILREHEVEILVEPQPEEPKALGSVVLTENSGSRWVLAKQQDISPWLRVGEIPGWRSWAELIKIGPVRVLWDGKDEKEEQ